MTKHPMQSIYKGETVVWAPGFRPPWQAWLLWDLFWDRHPDKWVTGWPISSSSSPVQEGGREREGENTLVSPLLETLITSGTPPVFMTSSNSDYLPKTVLSSIQVFLEKVLGIETPGIRYAPKSILNVSVIRTIKYYVQMNHAVQND